MSPLIYCSQHGGSMRANQPTPPVPRVFPDDQPSRSFSPRGLSRFLGPGRRISPGQSTIRTHTISCAMCTKIFKISGSEESLRKARRDIFGISIFHLYNNKFNKRESKYSFCLYQSSLRFLQLLESILFSIRTRSKLLLKRRNDEESSKIGGFTIYPANGA